MIKQQLAVSFLGFLLLLAWYFSFHISCISIIIPIFIASLIFKANFELANSKKICFANCYFKKNSFFYKILTKKIIIIIISIINSLFLTSILVLNLVTFTYIDFAILLFDIFIIITLYKILINNSSLKDNIQSPIIKNIVATINSIFFIIIFFIINIYQTPPEYINNDLLKTIHLASSQVYSQCIFIDSITRLTNEIVALKWWFILDLSTNMNNKYYAKEIMWIIFMLGSYIMLFAFTRYILEILDLSKKVFRNETKQSN